MNAGVWITGKEIRNVEFWRFDEAQHAFGQRRE